MANDLIQKFSATTTTVIDLTADLTNNNVGGGSALLDNSTELYPYAIAVFNNPGTFGAAPTNNSAVNLYAVLQDTDSTSDDTAAPTGTDVESARFMGAFQIYDTDEEQRVSIDINLTGIKKAYFYIENKCGQTITGTGNHIYVKITPYTVTPSA
jgi:hypothetical protein